MLNRKERQEIATLMIKDASDSDEFKRAMKIWFEYAKYEIRLFRYYKTKAKMLKSAKIMEKFSDDFVAMTEFKEELETL